MTTTDQTLSSAYFLMDLANSRYSNRCCRVAYLNTVRHFLKTGDYDHRKSDLADTCTAIIDWLQRRRS